jgi:hypothetical protein
MRRATVTRHRSSGSLLAYRVGNLMEEDSSEDISMGNETTRLCLTLLSAKICCSCRSLREDLATQDRRYIKGRLVMSESSAGMIAMASATMLHQTLTVLPIVIVGISRLGAGAVRSLLLAICRHPDATPHASPSKRRPHQPTAHIVILRRERKVFCNLQRREELCRSTIVIEQEFARVLQANFVDFA